MIAEFVSSWALFQNSYIVGWLIAALLALLGVVVVARDQIFVGAAVSEASLLGIAIGMQLETFLPNRGCDDCHSLPLLSIAGAVAAMGAALLTAQRDHSAESHEAVTGWVFLISSSLSILLLAHSPHALNEIHHLVSSTILGATFGDVMLFTLLTVATAIALFSVRRKLILLVLDSEMAAAVGMRVRLWNVILCVWLGLSIGLSIRVSGLAYTFGCLVLPALIAKNLCREVSSMFELAPVVGVAGSAIAFVLANHFDYPPGQTAVAVLCAALLLAWTRRGLAR